MKNRTDVAEMTGGPHTQAAESADQSERNLASAPVVGSVLTRPELIDVREFAVLCGCSTRTIRRLADAGKLPKAVRLNSLLRWRRSDAVRWIADGCPDLRKGKAVRR